MVRTGVNVPLLPGMDAIATKIVGAAYTIHKALGPGLLENGNDLINFVSWR
jgi:hypothetical protein